MEYKGISAGELATLLEVQRSNISHILNGRNMPGASFIEKFLISFPDLDARWLLTGMGEMISGAERIVASYFIKRNPPRSTHNIAHVYNKIEKPIDKVVLLFSDGTFIDYNKK